VPAARLLPACCALLALLLLAGCGGGGGDSSSQPTVTATSPATTTTPGEAAGKRQRPQRPPAPAGDVCQSQLGSFVASMDSLRRRLAVGVTYSQYLDEIRGIRSTYRKIPADEVEVGCLTAVATPAERAFNRYIEAANDWGDCVSESGCGSVTIEPVLQRRWRIASHLLAEAENGLRA
jgi:hypothetical protein